MSARLDQDACYKETGQNEEYVDSDPAGLGDLEPRSRAFAALRVGVEQREVVSYHHEDGCPAEAVELRIVSLDDE